MGKDFTVRTWYTQSEARNDTVCGGWEGIAEREQCGGESLMREIRQGRTENGRGRKHRKGAGTEWSRVTLPEPKMVSTRMPSGHASVRCSAASCVGAEAAGTAPLGGEQAADADAGLPLPPLVAAASAP